MTKMTARNRFDLSSQTWFIISNFDKKKMGNFPIFYTVPTVYPEKMIKLNNNKSEVLSLNWKIEMFMYDDNDNKRKKKNKNRKENTNHILASILDYEKI